MSFREKTAWVTLLAILGVTGLYFLHVPTFYEEHPHGWVLTSIVACLGAFVLIELAAYVVLRLRNPRDARAPKDELEQIIELKALRIAAYVYVIASFAAVFVTIHIARAGTGALGTAILGAFVVAEIVQYAARIVYYRRAA